MNQGVVQHLLIRIQRALFRIIYYTLFLVIEYVRSWRILIEIGAASAFFYVFLMQGETGGVESNHFFALTSVFSLLLLLYTVSSVINLGDRPQSYLFIARRLGRTGYLIGLYNASVIIVGGTYLGMSVAAQLLNRISMSGIEWVLGSIPLLLNIGLFASFLFLLSPIVLSTGWRLFVLGMIAIAFSDNFISGPVFDSFPETVKTILSSLQTIFSWPLVPAFSGFALTMSREYSGQGVVVIFAQFSLLVALLGIALISFSRRDVMFGID
jgi:hypothetical protein